MHEHIKEDTELNMKRNVPEVKMGIILKLFLLLINCETSLTALVIRIILLMVSLMTMGLALLTQSRHLSDMLK